MTPPETSLVWRAFDATSESRQRSVFEKTIAHAGWRGASVDLLPKYSETTLRWNSKIQRAIANIKKSVPGETLKSFFSGQEVLSFANADIGAAVRIHLTSAKVTADPRAARLWIRAAATSELGQAFCAAERVRSNEECAEKIAAQVRVDRIEEEVAYLIRNEKSLRSMANQIHHTVRFFDHAERQAVMNTHRVYVFNEAASPRVDALGNLYIGRDFIRSVSQDQIDLVLSHEAIHVVQQTSDQVSAMGLGLMQAAQIPSDPDALLERFFIANRFPDESLIDLMAVDLFEMDSESIRRYSLLLKRLEPEAAERVEMLDALATIRGYVPVSQVTSRMTDVLTRGCDPQRMIDLPMPKAWSKPALRLALKRFDRANQAYQVKRLTNFEVFLSPKSPQLPSQIAAEIAGEMTAHGCSVRSFRTKGSVVTLAAGSLFIN